MSFHDDPDLARIVACLSLCPTALGREGQGADEWWDQCEAIAGIVDMTAHAPMHLADAPAHGPDDEGLIL